ncbi:CHAT domain-containing protein [Myxosarcina sp. GI1]|uniref:CHAT domain-containing protein n=1 Tax=Myxosarcina sp. GI1 TaxID=1541065 RepID=UPI00055C393E|nr:CHAT domain-containing protein [Myxosarcina sp. GI1]
MSRRILTFICLVGLGLVLAFFPARLQATEALDLALAGQQQYQRGNLTAAAELWQQAADAYQEADDADNVSRSLINQAQALRDLGLYPKACRTLILALSDDRRDCNSEVLEDLVASAKQENTLTLDRAIGWRSLGDISRRQGMLEQARSMLNLSLKATQNTSEMGTTLLSLGNVERAMGDRVRDRWEYEEVTEIIERQSLESALAPNRAAIDTYRTAAKSSVPLTQLQSQLNQLNLILDTRTWWQQQAQRRMSTQARMGMTQQLERTKSFIARLEELQQQQIAKLQTEIESSLNILTPSRQALFARINYAQNLLRLQQLNRTESLLTTTLEQARSLEDRQNQSYALGYLGKYYSLQGQLPAAISTTRRALVLAQERNLNGDAPEATYLWQSQLGSLLKQQGQNREALAAYAAAFNTLQSLRTDLNANDRLVQFDFRQEVRPVYLQLVDLLLSTDLTSEELEALSIFNLDAVREEFEPKQPQNLELARRVVESLQLAELDNFFQDPCSEVANVAVQIDDLDPQAAVIYPIALPDRLAIIFSIPNKPLQQVVIPVDEPQVNATLDELYDNLYNESVDDSAINIVRTIPLNFSEIETNRQKLMPIFERIHSWLIEPLATELEANQIETLVFVLNGKLQQVPLAALYDGQQYLLEKYSIALVPSLELLESQDTPRQQLKVLAAGVSQQIEVQGEVFPPLINVPQELNQIAEAFPASQQLLNEEFTLTTIQNRLQSNFPVIHLATHGLFSSDPNRTFIVTGDSDIIGVDRLSSLLDAGNPELVVLSACETATGDERAILGLAGVTVRSGTRSTIATLWSVEDSSTAQLMGQFYQEFKQPEVKKAEALRNAQLRLLKTLQSNPLLEGQTAVHPYYWAPFVLVGNWQ